jgi:dTMP kinase
MGEKKGLFVVFEGIDGAGTSTQVHYLATYIEELDKYQDVLRTHEPWQSKEIKDRLEGEKDAYSGAMDIAELFVEDRARHTHKRILPNLKDGGMVICDRYSMSTCAYQWAQGAPLEELMEMHKYRGIIVPDLTFFVDVSREVAEGRMKKAGRPLEKFERDPGFVDKLIEAYRALTHMSNVNSGIFGEVVRINGDEGVVDVSSEIKEKFLSVYHGWRGGCSREDKT